MDALQRKRLLLVRQRKALLARDSLLDYCQLVSPDPEDPDNAEKSAYKIGRHHRLLAEKLEAVERGEIRFLIVTMPPRHGKSEMSTVRFPAWFAGRNPRKHIVLASATGGLAESFGLGMRVLCNSGPHKQVFPDFSFSENKEASDEMWLSEGGKIRVAGLDGMITGYGSHLFVFDDPFKSRLDALSKTAREKVWSFFHSVAITRRMPGASIVIVLTRWHDDDLVGRLFDEAYIPKWVSDLFVKVDLPALARDGDPLGREPGEALWPEMFPKEELELTRAILPAAEWSSLYQQTPADEDGAVFKRDMIHTYAPNERPQDLRYYIASDHALTEKEANDSNCFIVAGVDSVGRLWIVDCWWKRAESPEQSAKMLEFMKRWKPYTWFATADHISKAIRPFLRVMMQEERVYCHIEEIPERKDLHQRSSSIRARMSNGMVMFPKHAPWLPEAIAEMVKLGTAKHDDFPAALSLLGMGLDKQVRATKAPDAPANVRLPPSHSFYGIMKSMQQKGRTPEGSLKWIN